MKINTFKLIVCLLCVPVITLAHGEKGKNWKHTKSKKINKNFNVNANALLAIDNSYGNIDITTWDQNKVVMEIIITTSGDDLEDVQEHLDNINVDISSSSSKVSAKTIFDKKEKSWWSSWWGGNNNVHTEINYIIKAPSSNNFELDNDYGSIALDKATGSVDINCDYGKLILGELLSTDNYLNFDYTNNSTIQYMKSGKISADYSGFELMKADDLELRADYTKSSLGAIKKLNYNCDYGKITVEKTMGVIGRGDYVSQRIGQLEGEADLNSDYGSIKIETVREKSGNIRIDSDYTPVRIGYDANYEFTITADLSYANLKGKDELTLTLDEKSNGGRKINGYHLNKNAKNTININSDYGSVTLTKQ
ncbi:hypothetical protein GCM10009117_22050 [Gangjinia marincola]|uniref:Adhesin domain-containing protein n=1 Tax=Gangjinia marincola TaxID=578463 RepID=A0ABN1MIT1_9FLAO